MGHSEDDVVHKIPHKVKTHWQNQLKFRHLFNLKFYRIRYKKVGVITCQMPLSTITDLLVSPAGNTDILKARKPMRYDF